MSSYARRGGELEPEKMSWDLTWLLRDVTVERENLCIGKARYFTYSWTAGVPGRVLKEG